MAGSFHVENQKLRSLVAVQLVEAGFESSQLVRAGLEQKQGLGRRLQLALPAIDGLDAGNQSGASRQPFLNQCAAQAVCLLGIGRGGQDNAGWWAGWWSGCGHECSPCVFKVALKPTESACR